MIPDLPLDMPDRSRSWRSRTSLTTAGDLPARLTQNGELRVRVHGRCHGLVWCEGQRVWTWGPFAHAFTVPVRSQPQSQPRPDSVTVRALGLLGVRRVRVELDPRAELREPRVASSTPPSPRPQPLALAAVLETPALRAALPSIRATALPVPPQLRSRTSSPVVGRLSLALRLPRPGESR